MATIGHPFPRIQHEFKDHRPGHSIVDDQNRSNRKSATIMCGHKLLNMSCLFLMLHLTLPYAAAQSVEEPLFGITIRNTTLEQRFIQTRNEEEPVATSIMNSDVHGHQSTTTESRLRILPDESSLRFDVISTGNVSSHTTGINRQALIESTGKHQFEITKRFWFNGTVFLTQPGHGTIRASQAPQRVVSAAGANMPLLRPLADRLAWEQVNRRQLEINQAAAKDVARTVVPKVDRIVDDKFAQLGRQLAEIQSQVESTLTATPIHWIARSSESSFSISAIPQTHCVSTSGFHSDSVRFPSIADDEEIVFSVSESVATALLDRYVPGGTILTDAQLEQASHIWNQTGEQKWSLRALSKLIFEIQRNASAEPKLFSIQLAKVSPIGIRFDRGTICIDTSFQVIPQVGAPSGWMKTTWRLRGRGISTDDWAVALQQVDVADISDSIPVAIAQHSMPKADLLDFRIPTETTFDANEDVGEFPANALVEPSGVEDSEVTTVESGTVWMSIVKNASKAFVTQVRPATLPRGFDAPTSIPGALKIRMLGIESAIGILRAAFRLV
ncbi:MAG: hypothetical protein O2856_08875, partial [Planctomycetota bacterium]|nr:hypothetical protein [Planctomycetota bacterium]